MPRYKFRNTLSISFFSSFIGEFRKKVEKNLLPRQKFRLIIIRILASNNSRQLDPRTTFANFHSCIILCVAEGGGGGIENTGLSVLLSASFEKKKAGRDVRAFKILSTLKSSKTWEMHRAFRTTVTSFSRASSLKSDCQSRIRFIFLAEISMLPNFFIIYRFGIKKEGRDISISQKRGHDKLSILLRKKCFFHPLYMGRGNDEKIIGNP